MIVMKFGGTSVADGECIRRAASLVQNGRLAEGGSSRVVVISAMAGVTNTLIAAAKAASRGEGEHCLRTRALLEERHVAALEYCVSAGRDRSEVREDISRLLDWFQNLCRSIYTLGELTPRGLDVVSGLGERLSARIMAATIRGLGTESEAIEATDVIVTDRQFGNAVPLMEETTREVEQRLLPLLRRGAVPVVCGFGGATTDGVPTTLGRGGSDYTATIVARCLHADQVWLWTDVDGVMTADPRIVPEARTLSVVSYAEMAELSYFGAKVLHPRTMRPAVEASIPVWVRNTFNPTHRGTLLNGEGEPGSGVKGITAIKDLTMVTVEGRGMLGVPGVAGKVFSTVAAQSASVLMISQSSSEQSICFVVRTEDADRAIEALNEAFALELIRRDIDRIRALKEVAIIAVVGAAMRSTPGIAARVFGALASKSINVISIAQGSSEYNISVVVDGSEADEAVRAIHSHFELHARAE